MQAFQQTVIGIFSSLTLLTQILVVFFAVILVFRKFQPKDKASKKLVQLISDNHILLIFIITAGATVASLFLSDILGLPPCKLCWYQRVFMYPQVIVSGIALFTNDIKAKKYLLSMSIIGLLVAIYHILVQTFPAIIQCGDETVSCSAKQFAGFGYITIPVMSLTAFMLLILICLAVVKVENE